MALSDPTRIVLDANPAYYALYGYGPDDMLGKSFAVIFPEALRADMEAQYRAVFAQDAEPPVFAAVFRRRDGTPRTVLSRIRFIECQAPRVAMLSVVRDMTATRAGASSPALVPAPAPLPLPAPAPRPAGQLAGAELLVLQLTARGYPIEQIAVLIGRSPAW
jgi:PAS domain S-box-containing protein